MERDNIINILKLINVAYPNFYRDGQKKDAILLWSIMFADDKDNQVLLAVQRHIATNIYPPSIANIRSALVEVSTSNMQAEEAWGIVRKSISRYGTYRQEEALESMPSDLAQFTKRFGYKDLCMSENTMADRAHFIKLWDINSKNEKQNKMIPLGISKQISDNKKQLTQISELIQLSDKLGEK